MKIFLEKREEILPLIYEWAETFNPENIIYNRNSVEETDENEMFSSYESVLNLALRLEKNEYTKKDFEDILFHIEQINHNEMRI